jgi:ribosome-associated protein
LVIGSADSDRQTRAIADHIDGTISRLGRRALSIEGTATGQWVLIDFGDVVAHVFRQDARSHYALERLWSDAKSVPIPPDSKVVPDESQRRVATRKAAARKSV